MLHIMLRCLLTARKGEILFHQSKTYSYLHLIFVWRLDPDVVIENERNFPHRHASIIILNEDFSAKGIKFEHTDVHITNVTDYSNCDSYIICKVGIYQ